jgi:sugar O-acyltransferase (sialic acid O-acetyltransferase NeuD family)
VEVVIIGTGGMAKELWGMLTDMGETVAGFVLEDGAAYAHWEGQKPQLCGLPLLGFDSWFVSECPACDVVIANGSPKVRRKIREYYQGSCHRWPHFIHPGAHVFGRVAIGGGSTVMPGGVIQPDTKIGRYCHINMGVTIGHDCEIGDYSVVNHNAGISGNVKIGQGVLIGAGATIIEGHRIGDGATVGAGAVVTKDVPAGETWVGVPARPMEKHPKMTLAEAYGITITAEIPPEEIAQAINEAMGRIKDLKIYD